MEIQTMSRIGIYRHECYCPETINECTPTLDAITPQSTGAGATMSGRLLPQDALQEQAGG